MGRTVKTASMLIADEARRWGDFRKALRKRERESFDTLIAYSKSHFSAISNSGLADPFEAIVLSMLLELQMRVEVIDGKGDPTGRTPTGRAYSPLDTNRWEGHKEAGRA